MKVIEWVRELLHRHEKEIENLPGDISAETVERLIAKGTGEEFPETNHKNDNNLKETKNDGENEENHEDAGNRDKDPEKNPAEEKVKESCPYALKRNIVESLQEIRRFAEENQLAATMMKAILTLLAEMAVNVLKGKVNGTVLAMLLNALTYERAKADAYREGELAGRNAEIIMKHFPEEGDPSKLPDLKGTFTKRGENIFSMAREAGS